MPNCVLGSWKVTASRRIQPKITETTTDVHIARNIAERVHDSYKGDLAFHYNKEDNLPFEEWDRREGQLAAVFLDFLERHR